MSQILIDHYNREFAAANGGTEFFTDIRRKATSIDFTRPIDHTSFKAFLESTYWTRPVFTRDISPLLNTPSYLEYIFNKVKTVRAAAIATVPVLASIETAKLKEQLEWGWLSQEWKITLWIIAAWLAIFYWPTLLNKLWVVGEDDAWYTKLLKYAIVLWWTTYAVTSGWLNNITTQIPWIWTRNGWIEDMKNWWAGLISPSEWESIRKTLEWRLTGDDKEKARQGSLYYDASIVILNTARSYGDWILTDARFYSGWKIKEVVDDLEKRINQWKTGSSIIPRNKIVEILTGNLPKVRDSFLKVIGESLNIPWFTKFTLAEIDSLPWTTFLEKVLTLKSRTTIILKQLERVEGLFWTSWWVLIGNTKSIQEKDLKLDATISWWNDWWNVTMTSLAARKDVPKNELRELLLEWDSGKTLTYTSNSVEITLTVQ